MKLLLDGIIGVVFGGAVLLWTAVMAPHNLGTTNCGCKKNEGFIKNTVDIKK